MENDNKLEPHPLDELADAAKDIPAWQRKNDLYIRKKIAEARALEEGDASEVGIQKQLTLMDQEDKEEAVQKALYMQKSCLVLGWLIMLVGLGIALVGPIVFNSIPISIVGVAMLVAGFVLNQISLKNQAQRLENPLPLPEK